MSGHPKRARAMTIKKIICLPDPRLRLVCAPVEKIDDDVRALMDDMLETMYDAPGIGIAAIQIAVPRRVVVMDVSGKNEHSYIELKELLHGGLTFLASYPPHYLSKLEEYKKESRPTTFQSLKSAT